MCSGFSFLVRLQTEKHIYSGAGPEKCMKFRTKKVELKKQDGIEDVVSYMGLKRSIPKPGMGAQETTWKCTT
jgi:hypothetical protein